MSTATAPATQPRYRPLAFGVTRGLRRDTPEGTTYLQAEQPLPPFPHRLTDRLLHWATVAPRRSFMARRERLPDGRTGDWQHLSYAEALDAARCIGQALLDRGLNAERPVLIVSEPPTGRDSGSATEGSGSVPLPS